MKIHEFARSLARLIIHASPFRNKIHNRSRIKNDAEDKRSELRRLGVEEKRN